MPDKDNLSSLSNTIQEASLPDESERDGSTLSSLDAPIPDGQEGKSGVLSKDTEVSIPETPSMSKKINPKKILVFVAIFLVVIVFVLLALRLSSQRGSTFGTKGEIVWWGFQHDESVFAPLIEEYERQNPGVNISYKKQSPQDYRERLSNSLAAGRGPDIFEIHNSWPAMFVDELAALPDSVMSKDEFSKSFYPVIVSNLTLSKGIVAIPLEYDALTLFINEDIFASAIKSPPLTWDDLRILVDPKEERSLTVKNEDGQIVQSGVALGETANVDYWPEIIALMLFQNNVNPGKPNTDRAGDVFSFYALFKQNGAWGTILPSSTTLFSRGNLAMYFAPTRSAAEIIKAKPNFRFRTVPLPQLPKEAPTDPEFSYATYWVQGVWNKSVNKEEAWKFLKFLSSSESLEKINKNIKEMESVQRAYPRPEMNGIFKQDRILASVVALAPNAMTWYLADKTNDGPAGINSQLKKAFAQTLDAWKGGVNQRLLDDLTSNVNSILKSFGL